MHFLTVLLLVNTTFAADFLPKSFSFSFEQRFISKISKKEKISSGNLDYLYPGNIRFEIENPDKVIFVSNNEKSWYYTAPFIEGEEGELTIRSNDKRMVLAKFFDSLQKGLTNNEIYSVESVKEGKKLIFREAAKVDLGIKEAFLYLDNDKTDFKSISKVLINYSDDRKTTFAVKSLKTELGWNKDHFIFNPPPKTKISN